MQKQRKRTFHNMLWRSIRQGLPRFLSIFAIVALGCGFLVGLYSTCPDMQDTADAYYQKHHTMDVNIKATAGLTEEDLTRLRACSDVQTVQAGYCLDLIIADPEGEDVTARLLGFSEPAETRINGFSLKEGRMPETETECVLEIPSAFSSSYAIGDVLTVPDEPAPDGLSVRELTVVGLASGPLYMSIQQEPTTVGTGKVELVLYVHPEAFEFEVYTDVLVCFRDTAAYNRFSGKYRDLLEAKRDAAELLGQQQSQVRYEELQAAYTDGIQELTDAIAAGEQELQTKLQEAQNGLDTVLSSAAELEQQLQKQYEAMLRQFGSEDAFPEEVRAALASGRETLSDLQATGKRLEEEIRGQQQKAEENLKHARGQLLQLQQDAAALEKPHWIVRTLTDQSSYDSFYSNTEKLRSISRIFPVFFCLVAALVAMTTMTRMVEEERGQMGTLGAIGYGNGSILRYYLCYCLCACVPGCIAGLLVGSKLFPTVIGNTYTIMFTLPELQTPFRWGYALGAFAAVCGVILLATWLVCRSALQEVPASRMRPRAPIAGKRILLERISVLWRHFSFHQKVTARNLFRYKKRLLMTVVGVAGCTALLLTGFGLKDSIGCIVDRQYERVQTYDLTVMLREGATWEEDETLYAFGMDSSLVAGILPVQTETVTLRYEAERFSVSLYVPLQPEQLDAYLSLHTRGKGDALSIETGVVLSDRAATLLGISAGDWIQMTDADGREIMVPVSGVCENYILNFACLSPDLYESLFGMPAQLNSMFIKLTEDSMAIRDVVSQRLYNSESVSYLHFNGTVRETFSDMIERLDFVVYVLILSAAALAVIVLYNLNHINICERRRELATIKVLGFYEHEVVSYVLRESFVLTLLGTVFGLGLGILLHGFVIRTVEMDTVVFAHDIAGLSFLWAALLTVAFSLLVSILSMPVLRRIDMVDSLKANE